MNYENMSREKNLNEKLKGMINMKKIFKNGKKVVAGMVLTISSDGTAWHSYQIGSGSIVKWKQN